MEEHKRDFLIGVTTGWWHIARAPELLGVAMKIAAAATAGVRFVQIDFENTSEFFEPAVIDRVRQVVDDLGIQWMAHGEIGEYMSWEAAVEPIWKHSQRRLHQYLDNIYDFFMKYRGEKSRQDQNFSYDKYKPQCINFHASNMTPIGLFVERYRYQGHSMVDFEGRDSWDELVSPEKHKKLFDWFASNILVHIYATVAARSFEGPKDVIRQVIYEYVVAPKYATSNIPESREIMMKEVEEHYSRYFQKDPVDQVTKDLVHKALYKSWLDMSSVRGVRGSIVFEEYAYAIIAKYLELERDNEKEPLWRMYFKDKTLEDLEREWEAKGGKPIKLFDNERGLVTLMPEIVAMVASRYIIGHFNNKNLPESLLEKRRKLESAKKEWDGFYDKTAMEKLDIIKVVFSFENPEIIEGQREGLQRIIHMRDILRLVKAMKSKWVKAWFDSEHYLSNGLDPIDEIKLSDPDLGEYVYGFHVGAPKVYHAHQPIDVGSEAQRWVYIYCWNLMRTGFGSKETGRIIFERGGGNTPNEFLRNTVESLRLIVENLKKDVPPEKLPLEFYGVSPQGALSVERQMAIIKEHFWDPLEGILKEHEEEHTFMGSQYLKEHGASAEKWKKEELR